MRETESKSEKEQIIGEDNMVCVFVCDCVVQFPNRSLRILSVDAIFEFWLKTSEQEDGVEALEGKKIKLKYVFFQVDLGQPESIYLTRDPIT